MKVPSNRDGGMERKMKKIFTLVFSIFTIFLLGACGTDRQPAGGESANDAADRSTTVNDTVDMDSSVDGIQSEYEMLIDTEYYTLSAPSSWKEDCLCSVADGEAGNYLVAFYDKVCHESTDDGWLFTLDLMAPYEDYTNYPDYEVLGSVAVNHTDVYNLVVLYPSDVQFSEETAQKYCAMCDDIPQILETIIFKENCSFSEESVPVEEEEAMMRGME